MRNKFSLNVVTVFLRGFGTLIIGVVISQTVWSASVLPSAPTNLPGTTGSLDAVSEARKEAVAKKEKEEGATPWGWLGALTTAIASIIGLIITNRKEVEITRLTTQLNRQKELELEHQKFIHELQTDYDKDLRSHRIEHYLKLWAWMVNLPKYPKSEPLTIEGLRNLSLAFRDWYFGGGGLFLSENDDPDKFSESSRERYFDFQEGCKVVLQKIGGEWKFAGDLKNPDELRRHFARDPKWKPPEELIELAASALEKQVDALPENVVKQLRRLASLLRTSMTSDVLTRRSSFLSDDNRKHREVIHARSTRARS